MTEVRQESWKDHSRLFLAAGVMILSPFQYGIDFGMIGGLQAMPGFLKIYGYQCPTSKCPGGWNIQTERQQLISSLMTLGAFISAGFAGVAANKLGRKACLWIACLVCTVANIIMMTTTHIGALYVGRLVIGLANGYFMTFSQLYIQESSTAKYRGLFLTGFQFFTSLGTLIGTIVDWATANRPDKSSYLIPLGLIYVVPFFISIGMWFIPESPRWLILQGRYAEGRDALEWLRPQGYDFEAEAAEIQAAIDKEKESSSGIGPLDMIKNPTDRRRTVLAVCAVTLQAASGAMFIIAYKAYFFKMAKVSDPFAMTNVLSTIGIIAILANSLIIIKFGRRRVLLMSGLIICGILQLIVAVVYDKKPGTKTTGTVIVALSCLYMFSYNGMIATYAWLAGGELPTQRLRSYTFGLAAAVGFAGAWLTTFTAPYFINPAALNWGPRYGYIWFPSCVIGALWVFFYLPEVKNRTLEEIDEMFEARLPARKFASYKCVGVINNLNAEARRSIEEEKEVQVFRSEKVAAETTISKE
ncbi:monosaccharide transporter-like protein [Aaosphaeria arxii CBS 175.79]|uniref:Monosaccharide transporter-like protein n=1 Tax=Aaosphaeria arxii CBS 175.79 TaxID=1450172 RepID=A0A6A5XSW4_9PLEO|nr:monosaccharide transporter-like protein [Aaosphaeria arxii CBS 175.79]KAF2015334.1 monosaccharide transporter-like protein [Aaosphaeria arxii CBS 175.79]